MEYHTCQKGPVENTNGRKDGARSKRLEELMPVDAKGVSEEERRQERV